LKKSIKYAGIAAATLLAVAPVAAPVVSSTTTTVQAADTDANTSAMTDFTNQYTDYTIPAGTTATAITHFGKNVSLSDFNTDYAQFVKYGLTDAAGKATTLSAITDGAAAATVNVSAVTGNGTTVNSPAELTQYLTDNTTKSVKVTAVFNYKDTDGNNAAAITKTFTITKASVASTDINSAALTYTNNTNVEYGSSTADYKLADSSNLSVKDNNGNELVGAKNGLTKAVGQQFYTSYNAAYAAATTGNLGTDTQGATFNKENTTFYQVVKATFANSSAFAKLLTNQAANPSDYSLTVNGVTPNGNYNDQTTYQKDTNNTYVTVIRSFTVGSKEASNWTTSDIKGIVTTKNDTDSYTLKNENNVTITNRALGKNTAWKTDMKRVDQKGNVQYRVATGEWINANDVTFSDGTATTDGLTDIKDASGVATLNKPAGYVFSLFGDNGKVLSRALATGSAWRVDRTAKDSDGNTYYRVATGEWLQAGDGVSFK